MNLPCIENDYPRHYRILACDPGKTNFAWALMECGENVPYRILATGHFSPTIQNVGELQADIDGFSLAIDNILRWLPKPHYAVIERFMVRGGMNASANHEIINLGIGVLAKSLRDNGIQVKAIPASLWKNYFSQHYRNNVAEDIFPQHDTNLTEHQADACCICVWSADIDLKRQGLTDLVKSWPEKTCTHCFFDYKKDCNKKKPVNKQCARFEGPCSSCFYNQFQYPACKAARTRHGRDCCPRWRNIF